jgi:hypothetical protein
MKHTKRTTAVLDLETDPFGLHKEVPKAFAAGFHDGSQTIMHWGPDCISQMVESLKAIPTPLLIYAHNGGFFDFHYFLKYLLMNKFMKIINCRIVEARFEHHLFRDSYAILPFALKAYDKDEIDYDKFLPERREKHKDEILRYLTKDLTALYALVTRFHQEFGDKLTIGATAMSELSRFHPITITNKNYDDAFRPKFFFGGRTQCFASGVIKGDIRILDVNSMYPYVMGASKHPIGTGHSESHRENQTMDFIEVEGKNYGAFPKRLEDNSLDFTVEEGIFSVTGHEYWAALETRSFKPTRVIRTIQWRDRGSFDRFVEHFYDRRQIAKRDQDRVMELFCKFILNSAYGKFAQNPKNFKEYFITRRDQLPPRFHWCTKNCPPPQDCPKLWCPTYETLEWTIWDKPVSFGRYYNIATGASITGAARAHLLRGLYRTAEPLYCDTDSIICRGGVRVPISQTELGAWKVEASGASVAIAGKKLYALFDKRNQCLKKAHKGALLTPQEIRAIAKGDEAETANPVPKFGLDGSVKFTHRRIRKTAVDVKPFPSRTRTFSV